ncbi:MAG: hypothetical protein CBD76_00455 [Pelagibacteraceae bacterium TMED216]|nr:MAG: hypothetical protein CBD76_00455 [Pelagibacteraceae bacterium TMED216]|tara:strand:- start:3239 stop:4603 length:1365 start_codon:yes stop_codon:yes gene_type:complete
MSITKKIKEFFLFDKVLFLFLFSSLMYVIIYNLLHYDPILGYDAEAHYAYVDTLSRYLPRKIYIPTSVDTREFFNPPLAYVFPSVVQVFCRNLIESENFLNDCKPIYGNLTQIFQNLLFIISLFINMKSINRLCKKESYINVSYLILSMLLAVNYKAISMLRGEVYILFFLSLIIYKYIDLEKKNFQFKLSDALYFGVLIGLIGLSRQWAFLLFPGLLIVYFKKELKNKVDYSKFTFLSFLVGFMVSGWYYILNFLNYGTFIPFNSDTSKLKLSNIEFFNLKSARDYLFTQPIRPNFNNQFFSIFYSDLWGDYWGYFVFTSRFLDVGRDQMIIGEYLGRVNRISIVTTLLILIGFTLNTIKNRSLVVSYINISIFVTFIGYLWFVFRYPTSGQGDTIKSTYMVQLFNLLIFCTTLFLENLKSKKLYFLIISILIFIFFYNFESYLAHFPIYYPR